MPLWNSSHPNFLYFLLCSKIESHLKKVALIRELQLQELLAQISLS